MDKKPRVLVIIPAYNEEKNVGRVIDKIEKIHPGVNILVIDDWEGYGDQEIETVICGHDHGQHQMFATLAKIAHHFNQKVEPFDGGSIEPYDCWVKEGCPKVENYNKKFSSRRSKLFKSIDVEVESGEQTDEIDARIENISRTFEMTKKKTKKRTKNVMR